MDTALEVEIRRRLDEEAERTSLPEGFAPLPPIPAARYTDPELAKTEAEQLFSTQWLFVGHISEFPNPGDFRVVELPLGPIVIVHGLDGTIRAFYNSCRHRGAPVTRESCGTAKLLVCQYHSWAYDTQGRLKNIPEERDFAGIDREERALTPLRCEQWDGWIFVNADPNADPLLDWLAPLPQQLAEMHGEGLRLIGRQTASFTCNWKLAVHAFMEVYHVRTVHPDSAALLYDPRRTTITLFERGHNRLTIDKRPDMAFLNQERGAPFDIDSVEHLIRTTSTSFGIFPNVVIVPDPASFPFIVAWPTGVDSCVLELTWFGADWGDGPAPVEHTSRMELFETIIAQDTANLAPMQASLRSAGCPDIALGYQERLLYQFERQIDRVLGEAVPQHYRVAPVLDAFIESTSNPSAPNQEA